MTKGLSRALWFLSGCLISGLTLYFGVVRPLRAGLLPQECGSCPRSAAMPAQEVEEGFRRLGPAKPGEWRYTFPEQEQTFELYIDGPVNRKCEHRKTIYLQPLGNAGTRYRETLERMRLYAEAFFGVPAKVLVLPLKPVRVPSVLIVPSSFSFAVLLVVAVLPLGPVVVLVCVPVLVSWSRVRFDWRVEVWPSWLVLVWSRSTSPLLRVTVPSMVPDLPSLVV